MQKVHRNTQQYTVKLSTQEITHQIMMQWATTPKQKSVLRKR